MMTRSASLPGVSEPIWCSRPSMRAPSVVIQLQRLADGNGGGRRNGAAALARLCIVEGPLHRERDAGGGEEVSGKHGFQINADRWPHAALAEASGDREAVALDHLVLRRHRERHAKIDHPVQEIIRQIVAVDDR